MPPTVEPLRDGPACVELAHLHSTCLPASLLARLGERTLSEAYGYFAASPHERVLVARGDGAGILGAAVISLAPETLGRRLLLHTRLLLRPSRWLALLPAALELHDRQADAVAWPDLVTLFVAVSARRRGVGAALLGSCAAECRASGSAGLCVYASAADATVIAFYIDNGFRRVGEPKRVRGQDLLLMQKVMA